MCFGDGEVEAVLARVARILGRELDHLARHDHRHARLLRRLGEARCADLVHERAVAEDRVRSEQEEVDGADRVLCVGVVDEIDGELVAAEGLHELAPFLAWLRDRADHSFGRRVLDRLAHRRRVRVRHHRALDVR